MVCGRERWRQSDFEFVSIRWVRPNIYHSMCDSACVECIHILIEWNIQQSTTFVYCRVWVNHFTMEKQKKGAGRYFLKISNDSHSIYIRDFSSSFVYLTFNGLVYLFASGGDGGRKTVEQRNNSIVYFLMLFCSSQCGVAAPPISVYIIPIEWRHSFPHDGVHHLFDLLRTDFCTQPKCSSVGIVFQHSRKSDGHLPCG